MLPSVDKTQGCRINRPAQNRIFRTKSKMPVAPIAAWPKKRKGRVAAALPDKSQLPLRSAMVMDPIVPVHPVVMNTPVTRHPYPIRVPLPVTWAVHVIGLIAHFNIKPDCARHGSPRSGNERDQCNK